MNYIYKLPFRFYIHKICLLIFLIPVCCLQAQNPIEDSTAPFVIRHLNDFRKTISHPGKLLVDLKKTVPGLGFDLRYTTTSNFMHIQLYPPQQTAYLRQDAAIALQKVQEELSHYGLGLKIFDAYRPYAVTLKMWEVVKDDRYTANPRKGSGHNRGIAIDVSLINLKSNLSLEMGTGYDNFSDTAHHSFTKLSAEILYNRRLLKTVMEKFGFVALETEWWHYAIQNGSDYELLDLDFKTVQKLTKKSILTDVRKKRP